MDKISHMKSIFENKQNQLFDKICLENKVNIQELHTIAGVDLAYWKEKAETSDYYKNAIYTWTNLDVRKVKIAEQNGIRLDIIYYNY